MATAIIERLPDHRCYVEVFAGGLAVLLAKERSKVEVVNDIDSDLVRFYRCVRYHRDELLRELGFVLTSRKEFNDAREQPGLTDIQRAARWFRQQTQSFGGRGRDFGTGKTRKAASTLRRLEGLTDLSERLDGVFVEHLDWATLLTRYDDPETAFFLDPPYVRGMQYGGEAGSWRQADHERLAAALQSIAGGWVLTYDDEPLVRELYAGCQFERLERRTGIGNNHGSHARTMAEVIITPAAQA